MADELSEALGVKVKPPEVERVGGFFYLLLLLSLLLTGFTMWLLTLEWLGTPLPTLFRIFATS